jgi:hypothetical protein
MLPIILGVRLRGELAGMSLEPGEVLIKSYSESRGMDEALVDAGVVQPPSESVETAFVKLAKYRLS